MTIDIAAHVGENGQTASLYEKGKIVVFRKNRGEWGVLREKDFCLDKNLGLKELRKQMEEVLTFLNECRVFVGHSVTGIPFFELEKAHCSIWEYDGKPGDFLDYILVSEEERCEKPDERVEDTQLTPIETSHGHYRISIKEIQENNAGVSSKQVLLPFLRKHSFCSLEILCNHVPPWLEVEILSGGFEYDIRRIGPDEIRIVINKKCSS